MDPRERSGRKKRIHTDPKDSKKHSVSVRPDKPKKLEIVLKSDFVGTQEAVHAAISEIQDPRVEIEIIHSGVGAVTKFDLQMALTGSKLVLGFNVDIMPQIRLMSQEQGVEIRLYSVIYRLVKDLEEIAESLIQVEAEEEVITGEAKVIALFKSGRKGIILGCKVLKGTLALGKDFRIISAMGPVYQGKIDSLHIEANVVTEAKVGQQVGMKIPDFRNGRIGDLVECFKIKKQAPGRTWQPKGGVSHFES